MTDLKMNQMAKKMELVISYDFGNEITIPVQVSHTGTCLQLFTNWRLLAHHKLSQLISQQKNYFVNKLVIVSKISTENQ